LGLVHECTISRLRGQNLPARLTYRKSEGITLKIKRENGSIFEPHHNQSSFDPTMVADHQI
ncbi:MAG: hypothetical protein RL239_358, partial [Actinomycetota bacterium]